MRGVTGDEEPAEGAGPHAGGGEDLAEGAVAELQHGGGGVLDFEAGRRVNPVDATAAGLHAGDQVRIVSATGAIELEVMVTDEGGAGTIAIPDLKTTLAASGIEVRL